MIEIILTQGKYAYIDDIDKELVCSHTWIAQQHRSTWYSVKSGNPWMSMHRLIMKPLLSYQMIVDHVDGNGLNNCRENLRIVSYSLNQHNLRVPAKGYHYESARGKWMARIHVEGKFYFLGRFGSEEEAADAYKKAKEKLVVFGDDA